MLTENHITIKGQAERVFQLAANVLAWPEILPHYRWVRLISEEGGRRIVEMAAHRDGIPVKWTSIQEPIADQGRIFFRHIKGPTTGMEVEWMIREEKGHDSTVVHVTITHLFTPPWPLIGDFIARNIVGKLFVHNIAGKTLAGIKQIVESDLLMKRAAGGADV